MAQRPLRCNDENKVDLSSEREHLGLMTQFSYDYTRLETFLLQEFPTELDEGDNAVDKAMELMTRMKRIMKIDAVADRIFF